MIKLNSKKITLYALLLAVGIILSFFENMFVVIPIAGIKLGFANIITMIIFTILGYKEAIIIYLLRIVFSSILFGTFLSSSFFLALSGFFFSSMLLALVSISKKRNKNIVMISIISSIFHVTGQLLAYYLLSGTTNIVYYYPILLICAVIAGYIVGIICNLSVKELVKINELDFIDKRIQVAQNANMKIINICLLAILLAFGIFIVKSFVGKKALSDYIVVISYKNDLGEQTIKIPLRDYDKFVAENNGSNVLVIKGHKGSSKIELNLDNGARFISSPCDDKDCIKFGWINDPIKFAACLPNDVILTIEK